MSLQLNTRTVDTVTVVDVDGRITLGEGSEVLRQSVDALVQEGKRAIVLDLGGVTYIDSAGVGELVRAYTTVTRAGGRLALAGLTKRVHDLLSVTKLITVFPVFDQPQEAVASLHEP